MELAISHSDEHSYEGVDDRDSFDFEIDEQT